MTSFPEVVLRVRFRWQQGSYGETGVMGLGH